ncbi:MAG TPA: PAS domain S-box protein, partial [Blastocatellia bacterium]|nr:PAS domain S-box protein [Blastocatellia bacterium]
AVRADRGIISVISSDRAGGLMARRLLTAAIGVPFLLGWLHHKAQQSGYYDLAFGTALLILAIIVIFTAIIWQSAAKLNYIEQQHLSAEERFRLAVESAPNAMVMTDEEGRIVLVNSQVERVFGYTREELMGQPIEMLVPERFRRQHRDYRAEFANDPQTRPMAAGRDLFGLRKDGSEVPIEIGLNPIKVKGHTLTLSSIMDITERKRVEQTLADHLHELETVMEVLPVGLLIAHDREGTRIVGNRAAREFLRIGSGADSNISLTAPPGEAPTHMNVLKDGQEIPPEELPVQRAASQGIAVHNLELEVVFDDGEVKHELLNALPLFDQNGVPRGAVASLVDITDRKQIEADLRRANQLKDEFLATVSHELRTPLNAILGWATLLRRGILDEATVDRALETIERNAQAQAQLIEDLLDVSRIIAGKLRLDVKPIDLTSVIKAAIDSVQHAADARGIQLQMVLDPAASRTRGDAARLQQVVWNLLSNSIKFTPEGGLVQVRLDRAGSQTQITVTDTGEGINPEFLPYVFDRFQQADMSKTRRQGGLGLGLAIVRHIVELHGGAVEARSPGSGKGASFTVRLPLAAERVTGALPALPAEGASREVKSIIPESRLLHGLRILAVDDEPDTRGMVKGVLEQYGADVMTAASVRDAFDAVPGFRPDVLVCDIGMPEEDGYSFIHKVRELQPEQGGNTPAIALTGYVRVEERARALEAGFQMFVPKPVEADELASMIANLVGRMDEI